MTSARFLDTPRRILAALLVALSLAACGSAPSEPALTPWALPAAPGSWLRAACLDGTGSSPLSFSEQVRAQLVAQLESWVPAVLSTASPDSGAAGLPELNLVVTTVSADPTSTDPARAPKLIVKIPAVPAVPAQPSVHDPEFTEHYTQFKALQKDAVEAAARARTAATDAAQRLAALSLRANRSAVTGCAVAAALIADGLDLPAGTDSRYLVASDFVEEEPIELSGDFAQAPMTLVVSCPTGEVGRCDEQVAAFTDRVTALHAGPVTVVRAEVSDTAVAAWLAGA